MENHAGEIFAKINMEKKRVVVSKIGRWWFSQNGRIVAANTNEINCDAM